MRSRRENMKKKIGTSRARAHETGLASEEASENDPLFAEDSAVAEAFRRTPKEGAARRARALASQPLRLHRLRIISSVTVLMISASGGVHHELVGAHSQEYRRPCPPLVVVWRCCVIRALAFACLGRAHLCLGSSRRRRFSVADQVRRGSLSMTNISRASTGTQQPCCLSFSGLGPEVARACARFAPRTAPALDRHGLRSRRPSC